jgi:hypothetical protein
MILGMTDVKVIKYVLLYQLWKCKRQGFGAEVYRRAPAEEMGE